VAKVAAPAVQMANDRKRIVREVDAIIWARSAAESASSPVVKILYRLKILKAFEGEDGRRARPHSRRNQQRDKKCNVPRLAIDPRPLVTHAHDCRSLPVEGDGRLHL